MADHRSCPHTAWLTQEVSTQAWLTSACPCQGLFPQDIWPGPHNHRLCACGRWGGLHTACPAEWRMRPCDVIRKKYVFGPQLLAQSSENPWNFWVIGERGRLLLFIINPFQHTWIYSLGEWGWLSEEPTMWLEGWNLQPHPRTSGEGRGAWRLSWAARGQWSNQSCLHNVTSIKNPEQWDLESFRVAEQALQDAGRVAHQNGNGSSVLPPHTPIPCPMHLFWLFLSCILNWWSSK